MVYRLCPLSSWPRQEEVLRYIIRNQLQKGAVLRLVAYAKNLARPLSAWKAEPALEREGPLPAVTPGDFAPAYPRRQGPESIPPGASEHPPDPKSQRQKLWGAIRPHATLGRAIYPLLVLVGAPLLWSGVNRVVTRPPATRTPTPSPTEMFTSSPIVDPTSDPPLGLPTALPVATRSVPAVLAPTNVPHHEPPSPTPTLSGEQLEMLHLAGTATAEQQGFETWAVSLAVTPTPPPKPTRTPLSSVVEGEVERHLRLANAYVRRGALAWAVQEYELVLRLDPEQPTAIAALTAIPLYTKTPTRTPRP